MKTCNWREEPVFVLEALDFAGKQAMAYLQFKRRYLWFFQTPVEQPGEAWHCRLGLVTSVLPMLEELPLNAPEQDSRRELLILFEDRPLPERAVSLANHVIVVLPMPGRTPGMSLREFLAQWFDMLIRPGVVQLDWKDIRMILEPERLCYAVSATAEGKDRSQHAGQKVLEMLSAKLGHPDRRLNLLVSILADAELGLDEYVRVTEAMNQLGELETTVMVTVLREREPFEVWGMAVMDVQQTAVR